LEFIIWFILVTIVIAVFPSVRAWIDGGSKGLRDYNNSKKQ